MRIKTEFPHPIREIEHTWIPLADGTQLAARIWLPEDAERNPVPAILEYIPYRKNDFTALRDSIRHPYFAGHGYVAVRVDMRGSGESDGILYDEYLKQEQDDALEVIAWIAGQPWCSGKVGMMGKSWGGFNGLQVAARRPPALKAIITIYSTDDRYADDVHYIGGCIQAHDMLAWASVMLAYNATPPDPRLVGDRWRDMWFERMQTCPPYIETWLEHQRRDAYWQHGSVCENYSDITCAVYAVGGWADGYTNPVFRLLEGLPGPKKGLVGPWSHEYPTVALPNPAIGFMYECLRWWDYWLKDIDNGIMDEPMLRVWLQNSVPPQTHYENRPGRWIAEPTWPAPHIQPQRLWLNTNSLDSQTAAEFALTCKGIQTHGLDAGVWCAYGLPGDMPGDQRAEDGKSLCFTGGPLSEPIEILGFPEVTLTAAVDCPNALLAVRLCDVAPDGASTLVSRGLLNLTHRDSHEHPTPLEPGRRYTVTVRLNACGHRLPAGHRWRVAVSPTYWPHAWPSPQAVTLTLFTGPGSYLTLPVRFPRLEDEQLAPFEPPERASFMAHQILRPAGRKRTIQQDVITGATQLVNITDNGCKVLLDNNLTIESAETDTYSIIEGDPLSAHVQCRRTVGLHRDDWQIKIETHSTISADSEYFHLSNQLDAYEGNVRVFTKSWSKSIPRDLV